MRDHNKKEKALRDRALPEIFRNPYYKCMKYRGEIPGRDPLERTLFPFFIHTTLSAWDVLPLPHLPSKLSHTFQDSTAKTSLRLLSHKVESGMPCFVPTVHHLYGNFFNCYNSETLRAETILSVYLAQCQVHSRRPC